jgi:hypothetical protein
MRSPRYGWQEGAAMQTSPLWTVLAGQPEGRQAALAAS